MNERQLDPHITTINISSPLPSPPILSPNMYKLQYSVSNCSSVTLPPPPPPPPQQQQFSYDCITKEIQHNNVNIDNCNREKKDELNKIKMNKKLHHKPQKNSLIRTSIDTSSSTSSSSSTASSSSSSSSSLSSVDLISDKYYSSVNKKVDEENLQNNKKIQNIFDVCTNELLGMDDNFSCKYKNNNKIEQDNFILKSKPVITKLDDYGLSNKSYQPFNNEYEKKNLYNKDTNNSEPIKTLPKNRRKALEEVFPDLKPAIQEAQKHVPIINTSQLIENSEDEEDNYKKMNDNVELKAVQNGIDRFRIYDSDWCPASDLGDFDFDDCEIKTNLKTDNDNTNRMCL